MQATPTDQPLARVKPMLPGASGRYATLLDVLGQQAAWWGAVLLVRHGLHASAALPASIVVVLSVWARGRATLKLAMFATALGFVVDTVLLQLHAIAFPFEPNATLSSLWMVGLWAAFGTSFTASLVWLTARNALVVAAIGGCCGVLAYRAGASLGVLAVVDAPSTLASIGVGWAIAVTLLCSAARRLQRKTIAIDA